jgi:hypothetical protein
MLERYKNYKKDIQQLFESYLYPDVNKFEKERISYIDSLNSLFENWNKDNSDDIQLDLWWKNNSELYDNCEKLLQNDKYKLSKFSLISAIENIRLKSKSLYKIDQNTETNTEDLTTKEPQKVQEELLIGSLNNLLFILLLQEIENTFTTIGENYLEVYKALIDFNSITCEPDLSKESKTKKAHLKITSKLSTVRESVGAFEEHFKQIVVKIFLKIDETLNETIADNSENKNLLTKFSLKELNKNEESLDKNWEIFKDNFENYFLTLFDYREFLEDILWFNSSLKAEYFGVLKNYLTIEKYLEKNVFNLLDKLVEESKTKIERSNSKNLLNVIGESKSLLLSKINKELIVDFIEHFSIDDFTGKVNYFFDKIEKNLDEFSKDYSFIREKDLIFKINKSDISKFSPNELITPIVMTKLKNELDLVTEDIRNDLTKLNGDIISYPQMVEINLDSAESLFKENSTLVEEAKQIAIEGLDRIENKSTEFVQEFGRIGDRFEQLFIEACDDALGSLTNFIDIDKLLSIKIQASKEKAIQDVRDKINNIFTSVKTFISKDIKKNIQRYTTFKKRLIEISSKVGLTSEGLELTEELSKYLLKVSSTLNNLPYIYKKIYENEPLNKEELFIGRRDEIAKFTWAYRRWKNDIPTSLLIVGEKGSGTSSMINVALNKASTNIEILRKEVESTIYNPNDILKELKLLFEDNKSQSFDELIEKINSWESKKIVVIENIEDYFLKIVSGFDGINNLLRVIIETNTKIFWIATCNIYSWKYLSATLNINDRFTSYIALSELSKEQIQEIIIKRHNISGYKLKFLPSNEEITSSSFNKKTDQEKQFILSEKYFNQNKTLSPNNIAISMFLWLRSISNFQQNEIQIDTNIHRDFSFLQLLSNEKLNTLAAMLLHDGLTITEHALIFNFKEFKSKSILAALADTGIIFKSKTDFKINFQLYSPIINLLKNKNILH